MWLDFAHIEQYISNRTGWLTVMCVSCRVCDDEETHLMANLYEYSKPLQVRLLTGKKSLISMAVFENISVTFSLKNHFQDSNPTHTHTNPNIERAENQNHRQYVLHLARVESPSTVRSEDDRVLCSKRSFSPNIWHKCFNFQSTIS